MLNRRRRTGTKGFDYTSKMKMAMIASNVPIAD